MLELRLNEENSQIDGTTGNYTRYGISVDLERITSGTYELEDFRLRGFFNHHYVLTVLNTDGFYAICDISQFQGVGGTMTEGYDDWMNDIRPPRIDDNKFSSEVILYMPDRTLESGATSATDGKFNLRGQWQGTERLGRYDDVEESYSYIGDGPTITNPMNWILEKRDNSKTININNISSVGNTVTVVTSGSHNFTTGDSVRITGLNPNTRQFGNAGERYEGTFKVTVTGVDSFTYETKHIGMAGSHTSGQVEYWESFVFEQTINTIQGNGSGILTINMDRDNDLQIGDLIAIEGTSNYDGTMLKVTDRVNSTTFDVEYIGNTSTTLESVGSIKYSQRPPSGSIGVNYVSGYSAVTVSDHTTYTYLIYSDKDTYIDNNVANNYGSSTQLQVRNFGSNIPPSFRRMVFRFPVNGVPLSQLLFAEINAVYESGSDGNAVMSLYQMTDDDWLDSDTWDTINPKIDESDEVGSYNFINVGSGENDTYTKFNVSTTKLTDWITGVKTPTVGFVKTAQVNSISNTYWSTESSEFKPYIVVSSGVILDQEAPTVTLTDTKNFMYVANAQGDGSGKITITTSTDHYLSEGDIVKVLTSNYKDIELTVLGGVDSPTSNTFKVNIVGNTLTTLDNGGIIFVYNTVDVSVIGIDNEEMSDDPNDLIIRKTSSLNVVTPTNIVKSPITNTSFDFTLTGLEDGYFDVSVKDINDNQSDVIKPPIIMYYQNSSTGLSFDVMTAGSSLDVIGFNSNSALTAILADDSEIGGIVSGGISQTIGIGDIDDENNSFTMMMPSGTQAEFNVISVDDSANTILIEDSSLDVGETIVFNSIGNEMNSPLIVGELYFVVSSTQIGDDVEIQVSSEYNGNPINLDPPSVDMNMLVYNFITPLYIVKDVFDTSEYNNVLYVRVDDYAPKIDIEDIIGTGVNINVTISDIHEIDQSSISFINGTQTATPVVDVNGDGKVLIYEVNITGEGTFRVDASDVLGNRSYETSEIPPLVTPFIEIIGYDIVNSVEGIFEYATLNVRVIDDNVPAIIAPDNLSTGVFVEGSVENTTYGVISNLIAGSGETTFDITVTSIGDGVMTIYARDPDSNNNSIQPPVLINVSPECFNDNSEVYFTGINFNHVPNDDKKFLNPLVSITSSTMTTINAFVESGSTDGDFDFTLSVNQDEYSHISNNITSILDNTPPIVSIIGEQLVQIKQGEVYNDMGATAVDNVFGDVSDTITAQGVVDTEVLGTYYIAYTAYDPCGNRGIAVRQIDVVTGCPIFISVSPSNGYVGDLVTVTATEGEFNEIPVNNIVTFNGIVGTVVGGDRNVLQVIVPFGATSGSIQVETGTDNIGYEECSLSNITQFNVLFEDKNFDDPRGPDAINAQKRSTITTNSGRISPFTRGSDVSAIYNRDLGYSGFSEITDENSMIQNLYSIVLTRLGERIFNPEFGTDIEDYIHNIIDNVDEFQRKALRSIVDAVTRFEPRLNIIEDESFVVYDENINDVQIILKVLIPTGSVRTIGISLKSVRNSEPNI